MAIEKLIKSHKYDIVNTITTAGKPIPAKHRSVCTLVITLVIMHLKELKLMGKAN
jgi:hypothetical protein